MTHVLPEKDEIDHALDTTCSCCPRVKYVDDETIVIHNSIDGRDLIERGFQKGMHMCGITTRNNEQLEEGDVIETVQGNKFYCVNFFGMRPHLIDVDNNAYSLESFMSPNIWRIGNLFNDPFLRNEFFK